MVLHEAYSGVDSAAHAQEVTMNKLCPALVLALAVPAMAQCPISLENPSFESGAGPLANPLLFPPGSGTIGGWLFDRDGLSPLTGLTAPRMGIAASPLATHGDNLAYIQFVVNVVSSGNISRESSTLIQPNHRYVLSVDVLDIDPVTALSGVQAAITVGGKPVASSTNPSLLEVLDLYPGARRYKVTLVTGEQLPRSGELGVKLSAGSIAGVLSGVAFDNVSLTSIATICIANCDASTGCPFLNVQDFACFLNKFSAGDESANCDGSTLVPVLNVNDFSCFLKRFAEGCD
jgi:hypothetical protein